MSPVREFFGPVGHDVVNKSTTLNSTAEIPPGGTRDGHRGGVCHQPVRLLRVTHEEP